VSVKIKELLLRFTAGIFGAVIAGVILGFLMGSAVSLPFGGDKATIFLIVFLALPAGSIAAIMFFDKRLLGRKEANQLGMVLGFLLSFLGGIESIIILDQIGGKGIIFAPLIAAFLSLIGYSIPRTKTHR